MNIVITGASRGFGYHLRKRLIDDGNNVIYTSRYADERHSRKTSTSMNIACDSSKFEDLMRLKYIVQNKFDNIDIWINNAGISDGYEKFCNLSYQKVEHIINTNLTGTVVGTKIALDIMSKQVKCGHVFNLLGQGSDGFATPLYGCYGASKCGIAQFTKTLQEEYKYENIGIHALSPGMMYTDLLLENGSETNKQFFEIFCEHPDDIARCVVPKLYDIVKHESKCANLSYLSIPKVFVKLFAFPFKKKYAYKDE